MASTARSNALMARAAAYGPAHEAYMAFKRVVRNALGPASKDYRRIHLRASPSKVEMNDLAEDAKAGTGATPPADNVTPPATPPADTITPPAGQ